MSVELDTGVYCLEWDKCWNFRPKAIGWGRRRGRPGAEIPDTGLSPAKDAGKKKKKKKERKKQNKTKRCLLTRKTFEEFSVKLGIE